MAQREALAGYVAISPWIVGFLVFSLGPIVASAVFSLQRWHVITPPTFIGLSNYQRLVGDALFWQSLKVTSLYTAATVVLSIAGSLTLAMFLNQKVFGVSVYRTIYYLPSVITGIAVAVVFGWIFDPNFGLLNFALSLVGIHGPDWLGSETWALPALIVMSLWGIGGGMVLYLAALQGVPRALYEAAAIDGANAWGRFWRITLPLISPVILFSLITGVIGSFQVFVQSFVLTGGGPHYATLFYVLYLYQNGFQWFDMGYAAALSWVLFVVILMLTLVLFRASRGFVHYEGAIRGR
jgi:multiple sugar transport system permease protein